MSAATTPSDDVQSTANEIKGGVTKALSNADNASTLGIQSLGLVHQGALVPPHQSRYQRSRAVWSELHPGYGRAGGGNGSAGYHRKGGAAEAPGFHRDSPGQRIHDSRKSDRMKVRHTAMLALVLGALIALVASVIFPAINRF
jgi:hypothetical protein